MLESEIYNELNNINNLKSETCRKELLIKICNKILLYTKSDGISIWIYNTKKSILKEYISINEKVEYKYTNLKISINKEILEKIINRDLISDKLELTSDIISNNVLEFYDLKKNPEINCIGYYKIIIDDEFIGILNIYYLYEPKIKLVNKTDELIKSIIKMIGIIIKNSQAYYENLLKSKKIETIERKIEKYFEVSSDLVCIYELHNHIIKFNHNWTILLGWSIDELIGFNFNHLVHEDDHEELNSLLEYLETKNDDEDEKYSITLRFLCKDNSYKHILWNIQYINDDNKYISVGKDITQIITLQEEIQNMENLIKSEIVKNEFFTNMSHELKTPLNIILSTIQVIQKNIEKNNMSMEKLNNYAKSIKQNSYRLLRLVNNFIDVNKIDIGKYNMELSNNNIISIVEDITMSVVGYVETKNIDLVFDTDEEEIIMACNQDAIERIILNLLSNAIKYVPEENGKISIKIKTTQENVIICVKDNGIGIPDDKLDLVFDRFKQANTTLSSTRQGSGIGLALVKSLVELYGGNIYAKSTVGEGSEFIFTLPRRLEDEKDIIVKESKLDEKEYFIEKCNIEFSDIYNNCL